MFNLRIISFVNKRTCVGAQNMDCSRKNTIAALESGTNLRVNKSKGETKSLST